MAWKNRERYDLDRMHLGNNSFSKLQKNILVKGISHNIQEVEK